MSTDIYPYTESPLQNARPPQSFEELFWLYIQLAVLFVVSVVSFVAFTSDSNEKEDAVSALKKKIVDLEDQLEILTETSKRRLDSLGSDMVAQVDFIHNTILTFTEKQEEDLKNLLESRIVACESKLTQTISESIQTVKKEIQVSVQERVAELEKKIPRPSRTVNVSLNDTQLYFTMNGPGPRRRPYPTQWNSLQQPRLEITYALVPIDAVVGMGDPFFVGIPHIITENQIKETITSPKFTKTIPGDQKLFVVSAAVWHNTPGIPNTADCTAQMKKLLEI